MALLSDENSADMIEDDNDSNNSKPNTPMSMAASARDKLQASARELIKNFEDAMIQAKRSKSETSLNKDGSSSSIETAIRAIFSSCTTAADETVVDPLQEEQPPMDQSYRTPSPKSDRVRRVVTNSDKREPPAPQQKDIGEHIYAQLFFDDQVRAAKAVSALRDQQSTTTGNNVNSSSKVHHIPLSTSKSMGLPKPFPISSPNRAQTTDAAFHTPAPAPPIRSAELDISHNMTFDDSISAISAHTLEAMARTAAVNPKHTRSDLTRASKESSLFPEPRETIGHSPFSGGNDFSRSRSAQSRASKMSGKYSQSTRTTDSSSFDHWQREDNKYWTNVAKRDERKNRKSSSRSRSGDSLRRSGSHPHDTFPYDAGMFAEEDPIITTYLDPKTNHIVVLPTHTEQGEI